MSALVLFRRGTLDIAKLAVYRKLSQAAVKERHNLDQLTKQCDRVLEQYENRFPELTAILDELLLEIRLIVRGTPVTEPLDPVQTRDMRDELQNEQQYQVLSVLLKKAYRKVAPLVHPDKGGKTADFQELEQAYKDRDLSHINAMFIQLTSGRDIYWQQSDDGMYHAANEYQRPKTMISQIQSSKAYQVARSHVNGNFNDASFKMESILHERIQELRSELHHIRQNHEQSAIEVETRTVNEIEDPGQGQGRQT